MNPLSCLQSNRRLLVVLAVASIANILLFVNLPLINSRILWWQSLVALILTGLLPGILLIEWLLNTEGNGLEEANLDLWEYGLYVIGAGVSLQVLTMLVVSYLPGPIAWWHTLLAFDLLLFVLSWLASRYPPLVIHYAFPDGPSSQQKFWLISGLIILCMVGGTLRFVNLGYAEFQGDEARALLNAAEVIQWDPDVLFTHRKGPVEILIPTTLYSLTNHITEATARLPFAIINFVGLLALFLLGWRMFGPLVGWIAAMLMAVDGYLLGFAHIVQYQSVVFLMVLLVVMAIHRMVRLERVSVVYLTLAAIFLAIGLLAHYEALLVALPSLYLLYILWRRGIALPKLVQGLIVPILVGIGILALFYLPFVLNPNFANTFSYITEERIGGEFPYNTLVNVFQRTMLYSSSYYVLLMMAGAVAWLALVYRRNLPNGVGTVAIAILIGGMVLTFLRPSWLTIGDTDHTWLFFALVVIITWFMPHFSYQERAMWHWFSIPFVLSLFFMRQPNTHVYNFFMPWALLVGLALVQGYQRLNEKIGMRAARIIAVPIALFFILLFANYEYWYFIHTDTEILRNWHEERPRGYWVPYEKPTKHSIFGFPHRVGWKVVSLLYADGVLDAPFDRNGREYVVDWYTRGQGYCPRDHEYYILSGYVEPGNQHYHAVLRNNIKEAGYQQFGVVQVNGEPRLEIYKLSDDVIEPQIFDLVDYEARFDGTISVPLYEKSGFDVNPAIQYPLDYRFGDAIWLKGYRLHKTEVVGGEYLDLTLYWQSTAPVAHVYKVFNQVIDMNDFHKVGQLDSLTVCDSLTTDQWLPNKPIVDRYRIPITPDARPGTYTLLIGLYDSETHDRLPIFTSEGQPIGDALGVTEVVVRANPTNGDQ